MYYLSWIFVYSLHVQDNLIGWEYKTRTLRILSKSGLRSRVFGADQKERGLWDGGNIAVGPVTRFFPQRDET